MNDRERRLKALEEAIRVEALTTGEIAERTQLPVAVVRGAAHSAELRSLLLTLCDDSALPSHAGCASDDCGCMWHKWRRRVLDEGQALATLAELLSDDAAALVADLDGAQLDELVHEVAKGLVNREETHP